ESESSEPSAKMNPEEPAETKTKSSENVPDIKSETSNSVQPQKVPVEKVAIVQKPPQAKAVIVQPESKGRNFAKMALIDAGFRQAMLHLKMQQSQEAVAE